MVSGGGVWGCWHSFLSLRNASLFGFLVSFMFSSFGCPAVEVPGLFSCCWLVLIAGWVGGAGVWGCGVLGWLCFWFWLLVVWCVFFWGVFSGFRVFVVFGVVGGAGPGLGGEFTSVFSSSWPALLFIPAGGSYPLSPLVEGVFGGW